MGSVDQPKLKSGATSSRCGSSTFVAGRSPEAVETVLGDGADPSDGYFLRWELVTRPVCTMRCRGTLGGLRNAHQSRISPTHLPRTKGVAD